jgi:hypothetical protein
VRNRGRVAVHMQQRHWLCENEDVCSCLRGK